MAKELTVECRFVNPALAIIQLAGDIDIYNAIRLRENFEKAHRQGAKNFVINLEGLNTIDSAGIGVLFTVLSMVHGDEGQAVLQGANEKIQELFEVTQVSRHFTMVSTEEEALEKLGGSKK